MLRTIILKLLKRLLALQSDKDQDISFFASLEPKIQNAIETALLEN